MKNEQKFVIRAMPPLGLTRRFRAGRPWGKDPTTVTVVDRPAPHRNEKDRDGNKIVHYSSEISPEQLEQLRADPHFAVAPAGDGETDPLAINASKARVIELEAQMEDAKRTFAGLMEENHDIRRRAASEAVEKGGLVAKLQQELDETKAQLAQLQQERTAAPAEISPAAPPAKEPEESAPTKPAEPEAKKTGKTGKGG